MNITRLDYIKDNKRVLEATTEVNGTRVGANASFPIGSNIPEGTWGDLTYIVNRYVMQVEKQSA